MPVTIKNACEKRRNGYINPFIYTDNPDAVEHNAEAFLHQEAIEDV